VSTIPVVCPAVEYVNIAFCKYSIKSSSAE
jgi:hypothetical protein